MKTILILLIFCMTPTADSFYDFKMQSIEGKTIDFSSYKSRNILVVNTASECGYTPQYADLQKLHETMGDKITILGFPANNFGGQEPGSNSQISTFCKAKYGVTFQMFEKISVAGNDQHALYAWLKEKTGQEPGWNFCKYLIKPDGTVKFFKSSVNPMSKEIVDAL
jgi:glutathione peroxidase